MTGFDSALAVMPEDGIAYIFDEPEPADTRREAVNDAIGVKELPLPEVAQVDVYRDHRRLVVLLNGAPFAFSRAVASELAWGICSQLEAMEQPD